MKDRPILFSAPMVRALLAGTKTQTRRVVKLPHQNPLGKWEPFLFGGKGCRDSKGREISGRWTMGHSRTGEIIGCPIAEVGGRLWVRETWGVLHDCYLHEPDEPTFWRSDYSAKDLQEQKAGTLLLPRWRPSIHMPRSRNRITLEVTDIRVEKLQSISEADAKAEGISEFIGGWCCEHDDAEQIAGLTPQDGYRHLWERINGPGSWDANPWVWVISFKRVTP